MSWMPLFISGESTLYGRPRSTTLGSVLRAVSATKRSCRSRTPLSYAAVAFSKARETRPSPEVRHARFHERLVQLALRAVAPLRPAGLRHQAALAKRRVRRARRQCRAELRVVAVDTGRTRSRPALLQQHGQEDPVRLVGKVFHMAVKGSKGSAELRALHLPAHGNAGVEAFARDKWNTELRKEALPEGKLAVEAQRRGDADEGAIRRLRGGPRAAAGCSAVIAAANAARRSFVRSKPERFLST